MFVFSLVAANHIPMIAGGHVWQPHRDDVECGDHKVEPGSHRVSNRGSWTSGRGGALCENEWDMPRFLLPQRLIWCEASLTVAFLITNSQFRPFVEAFVIAEANK